MSSPCEEHFNPVQTDEQILAQVVYSSPAVWGFTSEDVCLGHMIVALVEKYPNCTYLLEWPDGVRAILPATDPIGATETNLSVVKIYRSATDGWIGPVVVGEVL